MTVPDPDAADALAARLRASGSVFAEDEAAALRSTARDSGELERMARRREAGEPLEHVVGWVGFGRLRLSVGPDVFVPRQRSLLLARAAVRALRDRRDPVMLEAYCGVAPIAASVALERPDAEVHAADVDPVALGYARRNLPASAGVHRSVALAGLPAELRGRCSVVAAVPPYVPASALGLMPREAREHEPTAAITAGADGLDHVRALIAQAAEWVGADGCVLVELHRSQYRAAAAEARAVGWIAASRRGADGQTSLLELRRG
ncbi:SAM-dependent methyltransferase [Agromyces arachidis]|uniref:SAM-dependent methyltransferase n=1 Tax=Agromyces arachidis TaxID=766966 RepID=UPI004057AA4A